MQPEEKLRQQAAIARYQAQTQKAKQSKKPIAPNATIIGYNAAIGANIIQQSDGSIGYAASDTNGAIALGESIPLHSGTMRVDELPYIKKQPVVAKKQSLPKVTPAVKVLFSLYNQETGNTEFYLGGDRPIPLKIFSIFGRDSSGYVSCVGSRLTDWVAVFSNKDFSAPSPLATDGVYIVTAKAFGGRTPPKTFRPQSSFFYSNLTDFVPTSVGTRRRHFFYYVNGGYSYTDVQQSGTTLKDVYYVYKGDSQHIRNDNPNIKGYPFPNLPSIEYSPLMISPLLNSVLARSSLRNGVFLVDRAFNSIAVANSESLFIDNARQTLVKNILYIPEDFIYGSVNITENDALLEIARKKIENNGQITQLEPLKIKVLGLKNASANINCFSYFPGKV